MFRSTMMTSYRFNVLITPAEGRWIAQCLEHDIVGEAGSPRDALRELKRMLVGRIVSGLEFAIDPFEGVPPAPGD